MHTILKALLLIGSHRLKTVFPHLYALLTVSLVLDFTSKLTCSQDIRSQSNVRASDTITWSFSRYKFVTNLD